MSVKLTIAEYKAKNCPAVGPLPLTIQELQKRRSSPAQKPAALPEGNKRGGQLARIQREIKETHRMLRIALAGEKTLLKVREEKQRAVEIVQSMTEDNTTSKNQEKESIIKIDTMEVFEYSKAQKLPILSIKITDNRNKAIRDFISNIDFYHDCLDKSSQEKLVKFVLMCKIQGKTLSELGKITTTTWAELKEKLWNKCGSKDTLASIQLKLNNAKQGQKSMREFVTDIEQLINDMTNLEVKAQTEDARPALQAANEHRGLVFLKGGVNEKHKMSLDCARHTNFQEAVEHLLKLDANSSKQVSNSNEHVRYHDNARPRNYLQHNTNRGRPFSYRPSFQYNR